MERGKEGKREGERQRNREGGRGIGRERGRKRSCPVCLVILHNPGHSSWDWGY